MIRVFWVVQVPYHQKFGRAEVVDTWLSQG